MTLNNFILKLIRFKLDLGNDAKIVMCVGDKDRMYPIRSVSLINHKNRDLMLCVSVNGEEQNDSLQG